MALNTLKYNRLMPLRFKGLKNSISFAAPQLRTRRFSPFVLESNQLYDAVEMSPITNCPILTGSRYFVPLIG